jgi:hypothetical protein
MKTYVKITLSKTLSMVVILSSTLLNGCLSHQDYLCALGEDKGNCASMSETYQATRQGSGEGISVFSQTKKTETEPVVNPTVAALPLSEETHPSSDEKELSSLERYLYEPAQLVRTYISPHVLQNDEVMGGHYVYWLADPGHWEVPRETYPDVAVGTLHPYLMETQP